MSEKSTKPFYDYPMVQTRGIKIIRDVKAEIKKMESNRSSTPFSGRSITRATGFSSRPSSSKSTKSLQYEVSERSPTSKVMVNQVSPNMEMEVDSVKLEPIVIRKAIKCRKYNSSSRKYEIDSEFQGFPPISSNNSEIKSSQSESTIYALGCESSSLLGELPAMDSSPEACYFETFSHPTEREISDESLERFVTDSSNAIESKAHITTEEEYYSSGQFSIELAILLPKLSRLIKHGMKKTDEIIDVTDKIYDLMKTHDVINEDFNERLNILRDLFRLLNSEHPLLRLKISKMLLEMKITDKNLVNVLNIILKLTKVESVNLNDCNILDSMMKGIAEVSIELNADAAHYSVLILKHFIYEKLIDRPFLIDCVLPIFSHYLCEYNLMVSGPYDVRLFEPLVIDIAKVLHHLVNHQSHWNTTINEEHIPHILQTLKHCSNSNEAVPIMIRIISKIADHNEGRSSIALSNDNIPVILMPLFIKYKSDFDLFLQLAFIIGNLVSIDDKQALDVITCTDFQSTLLSILEEHVHQHQDKNKNFSSGDQNWFQRIVEAILQNLQIWANLCLSVKAGYFLANNKDYITRLLSIVAKYLAKSVDSNDNCMVLSALLVVIGNTTYFLSPDSREAAVEIAESVIPLLDNNHAFELRLEAASIIRNLTRSQDVRAFIRDHSLYPAFIQLLDEDNKELTTIAYGIILNILVDKEACQLFYTEKGISRLIHKLHLCSGRDWKTSAHLCQILWNFCSNIAVEKTPLSKMEIKHLIKFLSFSVSRDEEDKELDKEGYKASEEYTWKLEFCAAAKKLLDLLTSDKSFL